MENFYSNFLVQDQALGEEVRCYRRQFENPETMCNNFLEMKFDAKLQYA